MTTPDISVMTATDADAARLAEIRIAAWRATYRGVMTDAYLDGLDVGRATTAWRQNILEPKDGIFQLVVQSGPQVVGFAILGPAAGDSDAGTGQLYAINVHPDWWAHGVGSVLFAAAEQKLIELGYRRAFLWAATIGPSAFTTSTAGSTTEPLSKTPASIRPCPRTATAGPSLPERSRPARCERGGVLILIDYANISYANLA